MTTNVPNTKLTTFVVIVVTVIWSVSLLVSLLTEAYQPLIYVSGPMLAVVGYATGIRIARNGRGT